MTPVTLPEWPWQTVRRQAAERGMRVWVVGGAVRDVLLGRPLHDWDFVVEGDALVLARALADGLGGAYFPLDAERGTGRVVLAAAGEPRQELDFAALRGEGLEADLRARDFTINALAVDEAGVLVDPTGGQEDLAARRVRATSERAFQDDPLRLLRAMRMSAELGFEIEPQTASWLRRDALLLAHPAAERVRDEFVRLLAVPRAAFQLERCDEYGLLFHVMPELESLKGVTQSPPHHADVWRHTLQTVNALEEVVARPDRFLKPVRSALADDLRAHLAVEVSGGRDRALLLKLATLLHDVGKPETWSQDTQGRIHFYDHEPLGARMAAERVEELRFSRDEVGRISTMVAYHLRPALLAQSGLVSRRAVYRYFRATGDAGVEVVLLALADHLAIWGAALEEPRWAHLLEVAETLLTHYFERHAETVAPPPLVTGDDLMAELGLAPGPEIGRLLEAVREAQAAGEVQTREEALALARRLRRSPHRSPPRSGG